MTVMNANRIPVLTLVTLATLAGCESPTDPPLLHVQAQTLEAVGDAIQLVASGTQGELPFWESLDTAVVSVTPAGMARARTPGTARVRARLGSRTADGTVLVMDPVDVRISDLRILTNAAGEYAGMAMQVRNVGGRGYYRLQFWRERAEGEADHRSVLSFSTDTEAPVGMDYQTSTGGVPAEPADWVVAYSRAPNDVGFVRTACVRLDGGQPCPMP
jgi:hypothetical protein